MERAKRDSVTSGRGRFLAPSPDVDFISTGCTGLNCAVGGGWPLGRIVNIVGDKSTGKTLLAVEACVNFLQQFPNGKVWYRECESAFDKSYAAALGMPVDKIDFGKRKLRTIEDWYSDLKKRAEWANEKNRPGLYILDSLDALSDAKEMERDIDQNSYGQDKAKKSSELFRKLTAIVEEGQICVMIISQVRDAIGVKFGRKVRRSGGRALDFYSSVTIYLAHIQTLTKTRHKQKRAVGVIVRAKCDKNKVGLPFREFEFTIRFGFGVDDFEACIDWLLDTKKTELAGISSSEAKRLKENADNLPDEEYNKVLKKLQSAVRKGWRDIEDEFLPRRRKYAL